ncbi:MAG: hypothetical protein D6740_12225 [Alphaproteobacteria bacterium]|nr:MAG: hypothetical protein D6740_12225 [Alphaproteobacteria bacterium]
MPIHHLKQVAHSGQFDREKILEKLENRLPEKAMERVQEAVEHGHARAVLYRLSDMIAQRADLIVPLQTSTAANVGLQVYSREASL